MAGIPAVQLPLWTSLQPGCDSSLVDAGDESGAVRELADESRLERGDTSASADADTSPASTIDGSCAGARVAAASPVSPAGRGDVSVLQDGDTSGAESAATQGRRCMNGACARPMDGLRRDARYCSVGCRQSAWRFRSHVGRAQAAAVAKRIGIADPPYPGLAGYYIDHRDYAGEVDHAELLARLARDYDGWALCTSSDALPMLLGICATLGLRPRVAAWLRGSRRHATRGPVRAWEPVLYVPARDVVDEGWPDDALHYVSRPRITDPGRVIGAKPPAFSDWLFRLVGARAGDELDDLFPGSGAISRAWAVFNGDPS